MVRRIMHVDMDAFYASVEQSENPELKGKPVIVGASRRGVVSAASYEARKFGVHSAMPVFQARRLCPHGIFLPVRMRCYKEASRKVMDILAGLSPLVEQISIDEAYMDISGLDSLYGPPSSLALRVKLTVLERTSLTCSIGIAPNKFLAKIASDFRKPDGLTIIDEPDVSEFLKALPIQKIPGIGPKTSKIFAELGVNNVSDVLRFPALFWIRRLGRWGERLYEKAQGLDNSPVVPYAERKSISAEDTFELDTADVAEIEKWLQLQAENVGRSLRNEGIRGKTITLKIKFSDFKVVTRSRTLREPTDCTQVIYKTASQLLHGLSIPRKVRLVGIGVSNLGEDTRQTKLFRDPCFVKQEKVDRVMDEIQRKFGNQVIKRGRVFEVEP